MPWKGVTIMDQRVRFISEYLESQWGQIFHRDSFITMKDPTPEVLFFGE
jgi:hypothetical protein